MKNKFLAFVVLAGMVYTTACKNSDSVDLKFNLPKGSKYEYATTMDMNMNQAIMGQQMQMKNKMGVTYLFEVLNDSSNWKTMKATINRISMDVNAMGQSMSFDTDKPSTDTAGEMAAVSKMFGAMKGGQFTFTMNDKGEVGSVTGMEEMVRKMAATMPNAEQAMAGMGNTFNNENFKQNIEQSFSVYPGKPIKVGETWKKTTTMKNQGMTIKSDNTYTLESVKGNDAVVKVVSKLSSDSSAAVQPGMTMTIDGTSNGNMHFDVPTGIATDGKMNMKMNMKMNAQGQEIPMNMDMTISVKGKKV
jgi:hypothetical protein